MVCLDSAGGGENARTERKVIHHSSALVLGVGYRKGAFPPVGKGKTFRPAEREGEGKKRGEKGTRWIKGKEKSFRNAKFLHRVRLGSFLQKSEIFG